MSNIALPLPNEDERPRTALAAGVVLLWFATVSWLASQRAFTAPPGDVPAVLIAAVSAPLLAFLLAWRLSAGFRAFVLGADLRLLVAMQGWRFLGLGFIALHAHGVLPGVFAWPAGLGDMAVAAMAPWMLKGLVDRPGFVHSRAFAAWNWLGIIDLVDAIAMGALGSGLVPALVPGGVNTAPMALLPLAWIPAFLVPLMTMFHIAGLLQARQPRDSA
jgi:hypothetical protein